MAEANRWISKFESESQELIDKIICSSSDSSDGYENENIRKHKKLKLYSSKSTFIVKPNSTNLGVFEKCGSKNRGSMRQNPEGEKTEINQYMFVPTRTIMHASPMEKCELEKSSPILELKYKSETIDLDHDSPVLSHSYTNVELSPILTNNDQLERIRNKRKCMSKVHIEQSSPDLFLSQATQIIEENGSPDLISQKSSENFNTVHQIEIISSQDGSSIPAINPSSSSSSITDLIQCYHQPNPRKKFCKKGGLLYQLKNIIKLQTSRVSLWHHDIFLKNVVPSATDHINCVVKKKWKEFGCDVLECCESTHITDLFLVCLGNNMNYNMYYDIKQIIKVFPPYKKKIVKYKNQDVEFYYNISKILTDNAISDDNEA